MSEPSIMLFVGNIKFNKYISLLFNFPSSSEINSHQFLHLPPPSDKCDIFSHDDFFIPLPIPAIVEFLIDNVDIIGGYGLSFPFFP